MLKTMWTRYDLALSSKLRPIRGVSARKASCLAPSSAGMQFMTQVGNRKTKPFRLDYFLNIKQCFASLFI